MSSQPWIRRGISNRAPLRRCYHDNQCRPKSSPLNTAALETDKTPPREVLPHLKVKPCGPSKPPSSHMCQTRQVTFADFLHTSSPGQDRRAERGLLGMISLWLRQPSARLAPLHQSCLGTRWLFDNTPVQDGGGPDGNGLGYPSW